MHRNENDPYDYSQTPSSANDAYANNGYVSDTPPILRYQPLNQDEDVVDNTQQQYGITYGMQNDYNTQPQQNNAVISQQNSQENTYIMQGNPYPSFDADPYFAQQRERLLLLQRQQRQRLLLLQQQQRQQLLQWQWYQSKASQQTFFNHSKVQPTGLNPTATSDSSTSRLVTDSSQHHHSPSYDQHSTNQTNLANVGERDKPPSISQTNTQEMSPHQAGSMFRQVPVLNPNQNHNKNDVDQYFNCEV